MSTDREGNDFGHDFKGCYRFRYSCGISVDSVASFAMGGIDGMLELDVRTKDLSKLFDKEF